MAIDAPDILKAEKLLCHEKPVHLVQLYRELNSFCISLDDPVSRDVEKERRIVWKWQGRRLAVARDITAEHFSVWVALQRREVPGDLPEFAKVYRSGDRPDGLRFFVSSASQLGRVKQEISSTLRRLR